MAMAMVVVTAMRFLYLFDPLCGWCYGASAGIAALEEQDGVSVEVLPTGLFAGDGARRLDGAMSDHILASDRRIAALTGAVFGDRYRERIEGGADLALDSGPATLALTAVAQSSPDCEIETLALIQGARYFDGRDVADPAVLIDLLEQAGLGAAAVTFAASAPALHEANRQRLDRARTLMRRFGVIGVPALFRMEGETPIPVDSTTLYEAPLPSASAESLDAQGVA